MNIGNESMHKKSWYLDYLRTTEDREMVWAHFIRDFLTQHRLRYIIYLRNYQTSNSKVSKLIYKTFLFRLSHKYGIEIKPETEIGPGLCLTHPYNITVSPFAKLGKNVNLNKGCTIGYSNGKYPGAPQIGNNVFVGINSTVIGGIKVGDDVLIAPNTLVNRDVPSQSVVIGNPAKYIQKNNPTAHYISFPI